MISVLITVPNLHWIHKLVVHKLLLLQRDRRYRLRILMPSHKPFENNLHHIINDFRKGGEDFWLTIDADNPPMQNPLDLVEFDKDIIGLPTPIVHFDKSKLGDAPVYWNAYDYVPESDSYKPHTPFIGLQKVDCVGTGCVLFAKRVFQHPDLQKGAFTRRLNPDGTVERGNDMSFSERARKAGFEFYAHFDYPCGHINEIEVNEMVEQWKAFMDKNSKK